MLSESPRVVFWKKLYRTLEEVQVELVDWMEDYNEQRPHLGRWYHSQSPRQTFVDSGPFAKEKL